MLYEEHQRDTQTPSTCVAVRQLALRQISEGLQPAASGLADVWSELKCFRCRVRDYFRDGGWDYLVLEELVPTGCASGSIERCFEILEDVVLGGAQKRVAVERRLSASTVASLAKRCLSAIGLSCLPHSVPLGVVMAVQAAHSGVHVEVCVGCFVEGDTRYRVVRVNRPDFAMRAQLTRAQFAVAVLLIDGKSHAEIAELRRRSRRTVANQVTALFERMRVSGRLELVLHVVRCDIERIERAGCVLPSATLEG